ncbi:hypothetical protein L2E82_22973 [Cichorium intybus]|uniref:Uncharacterized protein n=1 Tax=Cichorium intybus TaxID=13427 RepID=A0ACB9DZ85_CICIN|nr:hypothetical protein L2E82_22973 [Cichorium intybus]
MTPPSPGVPPIPANRTVSQGNPSQGPSRTLLTGTFHPSPSEPGLRHLVYASCFYLLFKGPPPLLCRSLDFLVSHCIVPISCLHFHKDSFNMHQPTPRSWFFDQAFYRAKVVERGFVGLNDKERGFAIEYR